MRLERIDARTLDGSDLPGLVADLRLLAPGAASVEDEVRGIVGRVRADGDAAVLEYTRRFDTAGAPPLALAVGDDPPTPPDEQLAGAIRAAVGNVERVALATRSREGEVPVDGGAVVIRELPVRSAAIYVPGGRAPYISTVIMGVVAARVAGVGSIVVCTPPGRDGEIDQRILWAARLSGGGRCGPVRVYRMGGAQAIAALAYGTESVAPVDVIAGPGNLYVQEAKRQVFGQVGIDGFAGPSDLCVVASEGAEPELVALDLLAQAEHGAGTIVVALSPSARLLGALERELADARSEAACALVDVVDVDQAGRVATLLAPEHLQLIGAQAEALSSELRTAGCVFVGAASATAFGDYVAGSNHILPTGGAARFASGLSPATFRRRVCEVRLSDEAARELAAPGAILARAEGFELHARSMEARVRENDG